MKIWIVIVVGLALFSIGFITKNNVSKTDMKISAEDVCNTVFFYDEISSGYVPDSFIILQINTWICYKGQCIIETEEKEIGHLIFFRDNKVLQEGVGRKKKKSKDENVFLSNGSGTNVFVLSDRGGNEYELDIAFVGRLYSDDFESRFDTIHYNVFFMVEFNPTPATQLRLRISILEDQIRNKKGSVKSYVDTRLVVYNFCKEYIEPKKIYNKR